MTATKTSGNHTHHHSSIIEAQKHAPGFRGYTLDEVRYQLMVNRLKIGITHDKIALLTSPKFQRNAGIFGNCASGVGTVLRYFDIAMVAYAVIRKVTGMVKFFRSIRK